MEEEAVRSCETEEGDFVPARPETPSPEEDSSDEDQVSKAFKRLKRSREEMSSRKKKRRIRMPESSSEEETVREDQSEYYKVFENLGEAVPQSIMCLLFIVNNFKFIVHEETSTWMPIPISILSLVFSVGSIMMGLYTGKKAWCN